MLVLLTAVLDLPLWNSCLVSLQRKPRPVERLVSSSFPHPDLQLREDVQKVVEQRPWALYDIHQKVCCWNDELLIGELKLTFLNA